MKFVDLKGCTVRLILSMSCSSYPTRFEIVIRITPHNLSWRPIWADPLEVLNYIKGYLHHFLLTRHSYKCVTWQILPGRWTCSWWAGVTTQTKQCHYVRRVGQTDNAPWQGLTNLAQQQWWSSHIQTTFRVVLHKKKEGLNAPTQPFPNDFICGQSCVKPSSKTHCPPDGFETLPCWNTALEQQPWIGNTSSNDLGRFVGHVNLNIRK